MSEVQSLEYQALANALQRAAASADVADCHGLLTGVICATGFGDPRIWVAEVFDDYNPRDLLQAEAHGLLQRLSEHTLACLESPELDFELLLPDDSYSLRERTESMGHWCSGFLSGLGLGGLPAQGELSDELSELLEDLAQISKVDFELDNPDEEEQLAFEEVVEYVRVAVLFIFEELQPRNAPRQIQ